jgi:hypothetical protein
LLAQDIAGIAGIDDLHPAQHLAHDHFDVLVVDLHALQTVHVLHFVNDVARQRLDAQQRRMSCGSAGPSTIISPLFTTWPSCTSTCFLLGNQEFVLVAVQVGDLTKRCLPLVSLPNETVPVNFASIPASFGERASNSSATRQTAGNVARLLRFGRDACQHFTHLHLPDHPSRIWISAPTWKPIATAWSVPANLHFVAICHVNSLT